jgi:hypothetical protein
MRLKLARNAAIIAAVLLALLTGTPVKADTIDLSKEVHVAVLLTTDAQLVLNGQPANLDQVKAATDNIASKGGVFWYARENGNVEPSAKQQQVFEAVFNYVMGRRLPIRLFTDGTFTKIVDN